MNKNLPASDSDSLKLDDVLSPAASASNIHDIVPQQSSIQ